MADPLCIAAVTGSRADWGLLSMPLAALRDDPSFDVRLIVTGQHLAPHEGTSLAAIAADGFEIDEQVDIAIVDDSVDAICRSAGLATAGIGAALAQIKPDLLLLLGDRYEILAAATAALIARIPVAHLCGGDITEGAFDDSIRHAITKLSHLHFVTNADARHRIIQQGEDPAHVHEVGSPGLDRIRSTKIMEEWELLASVGLDQQRATLLLVTYHPATLSDDTDAECREMLAALDQMGTDVNIIFTGANADPGGRGIDRLIGEFVSTHANAVAVRSLGARGYFSALTYADAVIGNSSSGLYEAPSFKTPTVNIGDRQKGRLRATSVIDCIGDRQRIRAAIEKALRLDCKGVSNPYGDGHATERIVAILKGVKQPRTLLRKHFYDLPREHTA